MCTIGSVVFKVTVVVIIVALHVLLSFSGPHTCSLLRSLSHLKRLSKALVQVLEFDCTDIKITEDISHITGHGNMSYFFLFLVISGMCEVWPVTKQ